MTSSGTHSNATANTVTITSALIPTDTTTTTTVTTTRTCSVANNNNNTIATSTSLSVPSSTAPDFNITATTFPTPDYSGVGKHGRSPVDLLTSPHRQKQLCGYNRKHAEVKGIRVDTAEDAFRTIKGIDRERAARVFLALTTEYQIALRVVPGLHNLRWAPVPKRVKEECLYLLDKETQPTALGTPRSPETDLPNANEYLRYADRPWVSAETVQQEIDTRVEKLKQQSLKELRAAVEKASNTTFDPYSLMADNKLTPTTTLGTTRATQKPIRTHPAYTIRRPQTTLDSASTSHRTTSTVGSTTVAMANTESSGKSVNTKRTFEKPKTLLNQVIAQASTPAPSKKTPSPTKKASSDPVKEYYGTKSTKSGDVLTEKTPRKPTLPLHSEKAPSIEPLMSRKRPVETEAERVTVLIKRIKRAITPIPAPRSPTWPDFLARRPVNPKKSPPPQPRRLAPITAVTKSSRPTTGGKRAPLVNTRVALARELASDRRLVLEQFLARNPNLPRTVLLPQRDLPDYITDSSVERSPFSEDAHQPSGRRVIRMIYRPVPRLKPSTGSKSISKERKSPVCNAKNAFTVPSSEFTFTHSPTDAPSLVSNVPTSATKYTNSSTKHWRDEPAQMTLTKNHRDIYSIDQQAGSAPRTDILPSSLVISNANTHGKSTVNDRNYEARFRQENSHKLRSPGNNDQRNSEFRKASSKEPLRRKERHKKIDSERLSSPPPLGHLIMERSRCGRSRSRSPPRRRESGTEVHRRFKGRSRSPIRPSSTRCRSTRSPPSPPSSRSRDHRDWSPLDKTRRPDPRRVKS